jgi:hypothetical protein
MTIAMQPKSRRDINSLGIDHGGLPFTKLDAARVRSVHSIPAIATSTCVLRSTA